MLLMAAGAVQVGHPERGAARVALDALPPFVGLMGEGERPLCGGVVDGERQGTLLWVHDVAELVALVAGRALPCRPLRYVVAAPAIGGVGNE